MMDSHDGGAIIVSRLSRMKWRVVAGKMATACWTTSRLRSWVRTSMSPTATTSRNAGNSEIRVK